LKKSATIAALIAVKIDDRQRRVLVSELFQTLRHEALAWNPPHRFKYQRVADAARGELEVDHLLALVCKVKHADAPAKVPIEKTIRTRAGSGRH
jgi:hypothetical protein